MTYSFDGNSYIVVLKKGEELFKVLQQFVTETDLKAAWLSGLGGALEVELGFYDLESHEYRWRTFSGICEIASLQGNISRDQQNKPAFHLHGVFADETYQTVGGHVNKLIVGGTCELTIREFDQPLRREFDDETGLKILFLS